MLNSKQILEEGLLDLEVSYGRPAQVGYDLSLKTVHKIGYTDKIWNDKKGVWQNGMIGMVLKDKTSLTSYGIVQPMIIDGYEGWLLYPGTYDLTFHEGCKIPNNRAAFIKQRSSLKRNGASISSPVFDPGFETKNMGTVMRVDESIFIEKDARVAQIYFYEVTPVEEGYNGQWQGDKQRNQQ